MREAGGLGGWGGACKNPYYRMHQIQAFIKTALQIKKPQKTTHMRTFLPPFEKQSPRQSHSHHRSIVIWHNLKRKALIKSIALCWSKVSMLFIFLMNYSHFIP